MLTIAFMLLIFTLLAALLAFAFTANRTVKSYRVDRALRYAADAALEIAVTKVKLDHTLGDTATAELCAVVPVDGDSAQSLPNPGGIFAAGSQLEVSCYATPGGWVDESYRDISFVVRCGDGGGSPGGAEPVTCSPGAGTGGEVLAEARVRYDYDPGYSPESDRARVPKIVSWTLHR